MTSRTDALGSQTQYTYDSYGRLSETQYYPYDFDGEDVSQRVGYGYDSGQNGLGRLTSVAAQGTYLGYEDTQKRPIEIYAKSTGQIANVIHTLSGDRTTTYDGRTGWSAAPDTDSPVPVVDLTGDDLDGARLDALPTAWLWAAKW